MPDRNKILFVCSQNKWRSLTAEKIFEGCSRYRVKSVGTDRGARIRITGGHIGWADWIFLMERKHLQIVKTKYADLLNGKEVVCLNIADDFRYMDSELIDLLKAKLSEYVDVPD